MTGSHSVYENAPLTRITIATNRLINKLKNKICQIPRFVPHKKRINRYVQGQ